MPGALSLFGNQLGKGLAPTPPPVNPQWDLGVCWLISVICAKQGTYGLQRTGDGVHGDSDATSTAPFTCSAGQTLFTSFWVKAGVGADGVIGFGYSFYNAANVFISSMFIETTSFPADWLQIVGTIVVPNFAVSAVPVVRATGHLNGIWCVDDLFGVSSGGHWRLSSIRHLFDSYTSYR